MNPHFFGKSEQPLFGIYYPTRKPANQSQAVLICPPIAHEHIRTHWGLRLLSQRLAREGFHTMRFDYTGIGDSSSWMGGVMSIDRWVEDVRLAAEDLMAESDCSRISIVGLRMGGALATLAAQSDLPVDHLVLWEPVVSGAEYLNTMQSMHSQMIDLWVCPMETDDDDDGAEVLGFYYQRPMLQQLEALRLSDVRPSCRKLSVIDSGNVRQKLDADLQNANGERAAWNSVDDVCDWHQLAEIETAWLQSKATGQVIATLKSNTGVGGVPVAGTDSVTMTPNQVL